MKSAKIALALACLGTWFVHAAEVSSDDALCAVRGWVNLKEALGGDFDAIPAAITAYEGEDGKGKFYVVTLEGGGYVVASGDDEVTPILAYSHEGTFEASEKNPLWCLLAGRAANEAERLAASASTSGGRRLASSSKASGNSADWSRLRAAGGADGGKVRLLGKSASAPADLRVPELLHSDWTQERIGNFGNDTYPCCFNLYTPKNYPCGCVATIGSQIMRYFEWPKTSVTAKSFNCKTNNVSVSLKMKGGTYDWANMPPNINTMYANGTSPTVTKYCEAIGKLAYDVGVTVNMSYSKDVSTSYSSKLCDAFTDTFGYSSAVYILNPGDDTFKKAVLPNLDAKRPCGLGVSRTSGAHAIVADGYGYSGETLYVHVNSGWGNAYSATAWYAPPTFDFSDNTKYTSVNTVVFNIFTNESMYASIASGRVRDNAGNPVSGATVTAKYDGNIEATATSDSRGIYALVLPPNGSSRSYSVTATCPGCTNATTVFVNAGNTTGDGNVSNSYGNDITMERRCAKLVNGTFHFYGDISCSSESELPPEDTPDSIAGYMVFFANDAEYQALVPYTNELKTAAGGVPYLQDNVTLAADADWRAMDFNLNGRTIVLKGWDLKVRKPQGSGRITSGNLLDPDGYTCNEGSSVNGSWIYLGSGSSQESLDTRLSATQVFTLPKSRTCHFKTRTKRNDSTYGQYVRVGITGTDDVMPETDNLIGTQVRGPFKRTGLTSGTPYTIKYYWTNGKCNISKYSTLSPESHLYFDIPENDEYDTANLTLGGSTPGTSDFGGVGLQVRKGGKGRLVMSKVNSDFGGSDVSSMVVEAGVVKKGLGATCGEKFSRIQVRDGAQFDLNGLTLDYYDYTIYGAGPGGTGALVSSATLDDAKDVYSSDSIGLMRNVTLGANATVFAYGNMGMVYDSYKANTMTMKGYTVTYDGPNRDCRIFLGNMSYSGTGKIVVAPNGWVQTHSASPTAKDCDVEVYGRYWQNSGNLTPVRSFRFMAGSLFKELNKKPALNTVYDTYAPPPNSESATGYNKRPRVQLGDADHDETTFDLSRWTTTFDDSEEGTLTFAENSYVTVDIGGRMPTAEPVYKWKPGANVPPTSVTFRPTAAMAERGWNVVRDDKNNCIYVRSNALNLRIK